MDERALVEALSAAIGGAISCTVFYPLDVAKTRYQVASEPASGEQRAPVALIAHIARREGVGALYRGLPIKLVHTVGQTFLYYWAFSVFKRQYQSRVGRVGTGANLMLGMLAGCVNVLVTQPLDTATTLCQATPSPASPAPTTLCQATTTPTSPRSRLDPHAEVDAPTAEAQPEQQQPQRENSDSSDSDGEFFERRLSRYGITTHAFTHAVRGPKVRTEEEQAAATSKEEALAELKAKAEGGGEWAKAAAAAAGSSCAADADASDAEQPRPTQRRATLAELYRGLGASMALTINPAIQNTVFDQLRAHLPSAGDASSLSTFFAAFVLGALSKSVATLTTFPMVRAKVAIQAAGPHDPRSSSSSLLAAMVQIARASGVSALYKGIGAQLLKTVLASALMLALKEQIFHAAMSARRMTRRLPTA